MIQENSTQKHPPTLNSFRDSMAGHYVVMLLVIFAVFSGLAWLFACRNFLFSAGVIAAAVWVCVWSAFPYPRHLSNLLITSILGGVLVFISTQDLACVPAWLRGGPFSSQAMLLVLGAVLALELVDTQKTVRAIDR